MEFPMFRNRLRPFDVPLRHSSARQPAAAPPKVISIPVHFVSSDSKRSAAARRIQKAFRGFLVRKSVKKILAIKKEVEQIERKFAEKETVDSIRNKDGKERLRMNETLMRLLFRLDSISGVDFGVRVFRRSVTKKVIMLQERLDEIVSAAAIEPEEEDSMKSDMVEGEDECMVESVTTRAEDILIPDSQAVETVENGSYNGGEAEEAAMGNEETDKLDDGSFNGGEGEEAVVETEKTDDVATEEIEEIEKPDDVKAEEEEVVAAGDEKKVLMEKMIEKNEMLIKMVTELCEKNRLQTEMLNSLSKRVHTLEKKQQQRAKCKKRKPLVAKNCYDA